jgi:hypothetical protein
VTGAGGESGAGWPGTGTAEVWARLRRPLDLEPAFDALFGLAPGFTRHMVGVAVATSPEADHLLDAMPQLVRSLAVSTTMKPTRCNGEIRGPVLWSETMAARAASAGASGVFVCASPVKAFDTEENRVLVAALSAIRVAGTRAESSGQADEDAVRRARFNADRALRFLDHRTLVDVTRGPLDGRALRRARAGSRRHTYQPAVEMLEFLAEPLTLEDMRPWLDPRTSAQHDVLAGLVSGLEERGVAMPRLLAEPAGLRAGPVVYRHARRHADGAAETDTGGIVVGPLLVDVPSRIAEPNPFRAQAELAERAAGRPHYLVQTFADIPRAVELAVRAVRAPLTAVD